MTQFKNSFEEDCYNSCLPFLSKDSVTIEHNQVVKTEKTIISFSGKPKKEIDVLALNFPNNIKLLISCKNYSNSAPPSSIQEWGDVIKVLNENSIVSTYFGLVISSNGFTSGCESWAKTDNLGIIPPYRGKKETFSKDTILKMMQRTIHVFLRTIERRGHDSLEENNNFYWMCYKNIADFETNEQKSK